MVSIQAIMQRNGDVDSIEELYNRVENAESVSVIVRLINEDKNVTLSPAGDELVISLSGADAGPIHVSYPESARELNDSIEFALQEYN